MTTTGPEAAAQPATPREAPPPRPPWWRRWRLGTVVVVYAVALLALGGWGFARALAPPEPAAGAAPPCVVDAAVATAPAPVKLAPLGTPVTSIAFGRGLSEQDRQFEFTLAEPLPARNPACLQVRVNPFLRTGDGASAELDLSRIRAGAAVAGRQVLVSLTVDRSSVHFAPPGSYTGTVSIVDPRVERVDIPLTVSLSYPVWQLPLVALLLVLPVAVTNLWLLKGSFAKNLQTVTVALFDDYAFSRNGFLAIGAGVAAAVLVFSTTYLSSPTWGVSFVDVLSLFGGAFAAFTAAATPVTAAGVDNSDSLTKPS